MNLIIRAGSTCKSCHCESIIIMLGNEIEAGTRNEMFIHFNSKTFTSSGRRHSLVLGWSLALSLIMHLGLIALYNGRFTTVVEKVNVHDAGKINIRLQKPSVVAVVEAISEKPQSRVDALTNPANTGVGNLPSEKKISATKAAVTNQTPLQINENQTTLESVITKISPYDYAERDAGNYEFSQTQHFDDVFDSQLRKQLNENRRAPSAINNSELKSSVSIHGETRVVLANGQCLTARAPQIGAPTDWYLSGGCGQDEGEQMMERVNAEIRARRR